MDYHRRPKPWKLMKQLGVNDSLLRFWSSCRLLLDQLDFEFGFCGAAIARDLEACVRGFVRETLNKVFLRKFGLWMLGSEFTSNRCYTLQNQQQSPVGAV
ncbi:hypothetical protein EUGRSUZ_E02566 [Eucalyptus grandis]|uniref:Uncharacterized protein n=2 Tax=Eucalyptus grandis TaxID=71139 RepID=A0ACC3KXF9_EUCGR|nr:hypothetical protein EUGRSUZ_E02566 [Eucalyptus grandis]